MHGQPAVWPHVLKTQRHLRFPLGGLLGKGQLQHVRGWPGRRGEDTKTRRESGEMTLSRTSHASLLTSLL